MSRLNRKIAWRLVLALALMVGQAGAQVHAYAHLASDSRPVAPAGLHTQPCNQCLSFAPLLSAVGPASNVLSFDWGEALTPVRPIAVASRVQPRLHGFQSRAPPALF